MFKCYIKLSMICSLLLYMGIISGCQPANETNTIKITSFIEEFPEFIEECPVKSNTCAISGASEGSVYYTLRDDKIKNTFSFKKFDLTTRTATTLIDFGKSAGYIHIGTVIEIDDVLYYTDERQMPEYKNMTQYAVNAIKDGNIIELDSGTYPTSIDCINMKRVNDSIIYAAIDYGITEDFDETGNGTYGYKVGKIKDLTVEYLTDYKVPMKNHSVALNTEILEFQDYDNSISETYSLMLTKDNDLYIKVYNETGLINSINLDEISSKFRRWGFMRYCNDYAIFQEYLDDENSIYHTLDFETHEIKELNGDNYHTEFFKVINDDVSYAFNFVPNTQEKMDNFIVKKVNDELHFEKLNLIHDDESDFAVYVITKNKVLLCNRNYGNDYYIVEF